MDISKAQRKLKSLIKEIEKEGSYLDEHGCGCILEDLKEILKYLD